MATAEFRIQIDMTACEAMIAEFRAHVERLGQDEAAQRLGGEIDVRQYIVLEWPEKDVAHAVPTAAFRDALATLAAG
jgi:hypothetical protein